MAEFLEYIVQMIRGRGDLSETDKAVLCMIVSNELNIDFLTVLADKDRVDLGSLYEIELAYKQYYGTMRAWKPQDFANMLQLLKQQYEKEQNNNTKSITITFN